MRTPAWHDAAVWLSFGAIFLTLELPAVFWPGCPWQTLSATSWRFEHWWHPLVFFLAVALLALGVHILREAPVRYLITAVVGMVVAVGLHVAWDKIAT